MLWVIVAGLQQSMPRRQTRGYERPYAMNGEVATLESSFPDEKSDISDE